MKRLENKTHRYTDTHQHRQTQIGIHTHQHSNRQANIHTDRDKHSQKTITDPQTHKHNKVNSEAYLFV